MSFFAMLFALLIEQVKPLPDRNLVHRGISAWVQWVGRNFNAGAKEHARVVWAMTVIGPTLVTVLIHAVVDHQSQLLGFLFNVLVLYLTMGFRQFSHHFTEIRKALEQGHPNQASQLLKQWQHFNTDDLSRDELVRRVLECAILAAHRHVFAVFFWFVVFAILGLGPAGAVLFRMAEFSNRYWSFRHHKSDEAIHGILMDVSGKLFNMIDAVPARLTAFGFAVVGNFEEVVDAWRLYANSGVQRNEGIILSAAAGALGVGLGAHHQPTGIDDVETLEPTQQASSMGVIPKMDHLRSAVGLIWRSVVLWMLLLALLSMVSRVGA